MLRKEFLPPEDQSRFNLRFFTKIGSNLAYTDRHVLEIEQFLNKFASWRRNPPIRPRRSRGRRWFHPRVRRTPPRS